MNLFDGSPNTYKMEDICKEKQWEKKNKKKTVQPFIKNCNNFAVQCMSASSSTEKPGNYAWVCMRYIDKFKKKNELLLSGRNMILLKH